MAVLPLFASRFVVGLSAFGFAVCLCLLPALLLGFFAFWLNKLIVQYIYSCLGFYLFFNILISDLNMSLLPNTSCASDANSLLKRKSNDIGWEFGQLIDPRNLDKVKCKLCGKTFSGGGYID